MKNLLIFMGLLVTCSGSKWLQEEPKSVSEGTFYNTEQEAAAAVLAPLNKLRSGFSTSHYGLMESFADYQYGRRSYASTSDYTGLDPQNLNRTVWLWASLYNAIRDCNIAIGHLPQASTRQTYQARKKDGEGKK